ncbi:MAG: hypothetical protein QXU73_06910 [Thermoplasmata archaeon]
MTEGSDIINMVIALLITIFVEIVAVGPLIETLLLEIEYPGVSEGTLQLLHLVFVIGSAIPIFGAVIAVLNKVVR